MRTGQVIDLSQRLEGTNREKVLGALRSLTDEHNRVTLNELIQLFDRSGFNKGSISPALSALNAEHPHVHSAETGPLRPVTNRPTMEYWYDEKKPKQIVRPKWTGNTPPPKAGFIRDVIADVINVSNRRLTSKQILRILRKDKSRKWPASIAGHMVHVLGHFPHIHADKSKRLHEFYMDLSSYNEVWAGKHPEQVASFLREQRKRTPVSKRESVGYFWPAQEGEITTAEFADAVRTINRYMAQPGADVVLSIGEGKLHARARVVSYQEIE